MLILLRSVPGLTDKLLSGTNVDDGVNKFVVSLKRVAAATEQKKCSSSHTFLKCVCMTWSFVRLSEFDSEVSNINRLVYIKIMESSR